MNRTRRERLEQRPPGYLELVEAEDRYGLIAGAGFAALFLSAIGGVITAALGLWWWWAFAISAAASHVTTRAARARLRRVRARRRTLASRALEQDREVGR